MKQIAQNYKTGELKNQVTKGPWVVRGIEWIDREKEAALMLAMFETKIVMV